MGAPRPNPDLPLFLAPGQAVPVPETGRGAAPVEPYQDDPRCELVGCDAPLPPSPGNEETIRYCCREHRREARAQRSRARHGGER
ncbi:hypothetical protein GCM10023320_31170 [Pseudonocardia adelaidensis]|uniref:GcrA cell cycle regulator n=1 Tax=Pseudonocardia adelaidensis TaxID=648754 RepID=A0ABP9NKM9_9PSEU